MRISELYAYAPKSKIKANEADPNGEYQFFSSSQKENGRHNAFIYNFPAIILGTGGSASIHYYDGKFSTSTDCLVLIPNDKIVPKYLYYYFLANKRILDSGFKGIGLKHISKNFIDNICVNEIPSIEKQRENIKIL